MTDCSLLYGCPGTVAVDEYSIRNAGGVAINPYLAHLNAIPREGTVVEGLPLGSYWVLGSGHRSRTSITPTAVAVNDASLSTFPITQAITFTSAKPARAVVGGTYIPTATGGGSGNPVVFTIAPTASTICSIASGKVTFHKVGTCTIDANQAGNTNYAAPLQKAQSIVIKA